MTRRAKARTTQQERDRIIGILSADGPMTVAVLSDVSGIETYPLTGALNRLSNEGRVRKVSSVRPVRWEAVR